MKTYAAVAAVLCVCALGFAASAATGQEPQTGPDGHLMDCNPTGGYDLSAENVRRAERMILNRIIREADSGDPAELLKLSQTLSTLQAVEGQQDALQVARAIEPQLNHLPEMVQTIQREIVVQNVGNMLDEFRRHNEAMLPLMRGIIQVWGNSLDMGAKVRQDIRDADAAAEAEAEAAAAADEQRQRIIAATYTWKYVGSRNAAQVYQFTRRDGEKIDAKADAILVDHFDEEWTAVEGQYLLADDGHLNPKGVLMAFDRWDFQHRGVSAKLAGLTAK